MFQDYIKPSSHGVTSVTMQSKPSFLAGAHSTDAPQSTFNAAGGHIFNLIYYYNSKEDSSRILSTLRPVERDGHLHGCMEGTRKGTLAEISDWLDDFTAPNILLLIGSPGVGKSAIAATVVADLDKRKRLGSSFAFKHNNTHLSDPDAVWRTVAFDLARFHSDVTASLVEILKGVDPGSSDLNLQFQRLIEAPLTKNHIRKLGWYGQCLIRLCNMQNIHNICNSYT